MNRNSILFACILLLTACSEYSQKKQVVEKEDLEAKALLQGTWVDDMTYTPLLRFKGDTLYYLNESVRPVPFKIVNDSLKTYGTQVSSYHIKKQGESIFWIQSSMGEILQLSKSENQVDTILPVQVSDTDEVTRKVIEKDHVVHFNDKRYRGYVYINPTDIKIVQPEMTEEGLEVENVYYDNIIHICVYEGKNKLFGRDMKKQDFESLVPQEYYQRAILSDMDFVGVNAKGYQYQANLCIPNNATCYLVDISISKDGDIVYALVQ